MLQDPLYLSRLNPGAPDPSLVTADGAVVTFDVAPGKSVRVLNPFMGGKATLSISHSESKENKGQITDRTAFSFRGPKDTRIRAGCRCSSHADRFFSKKRF